MEQQGDPTPNAADDSRPSTLGALAARLRHHWGVLVAIVVPLVTVATIVIPLIADANQRLTSAQTLEVGTSTTAPTAARTAPAAVGDAKAAVAASDLNSRELVGQSIAEQFPNSNWRVAADAPWDTFPVSEADDVYTCTSAQVEWLTKWGRRDIADIWNGYLTLTNTATDGSAMSVRNIHSVGEFIEPKSPEVAVYCALGTGGESSIIPLEQDLGTNHPAVFADSSGGGPQGAPATLNIAPGQYLQIFVDFKRGKHVTDDFSGSLVGDIVVGGTTTHTVLFNGFTREGAPAISTTSLTVFGNYLQCGPDFTNRCTIAQFVSQLKTDPGYQG